MELRVTGEAYVVSNGEWLDGTHTRARLRLVTWQSRYDKVTGQWIKIGESVFFNGVSFYSRVSKAVVDCAKGEFVFIEGALRQTTDNERITYWVQLYNIYIRPYRFNQDETGSNNSLPPLPDDIDTIGSVPMPDAATDFP